jgi:hypothetical protein
MLDLSDWLVTAGVARFRLCHTVSFCHDAAHSALQIFEIELLRWESVNDLSDEKDGSLMKKIVTEGDLNVWDRPKDTDLVVVKLSAKVAGAEEYFEKDLVHEFKVEDGFFCPAVLRVVKEMKQGEVVHVKVCWRQARISCLHSNPGLYLRCCSAFTVHT